MHIEYEEESQELKTAPLEAAEKPAKKQGIWHIIRFIVVTGLIFGITFFTVNFSAYKNILASLLNPEKQAQAQELLEKSSLSKIDPEKLLPTLPNQPETQTEYPWLGFDILPTDNRLVIPKLAKNVPLVSMGTENLDEKDWVELEKEIQGNLQNGVVLYPKTAKPGNFGNVFITGHSSYYAWDPGLFKDVFSLLHQLEVGDTYYVDYEGKRYVYEVYKKFEVYPNEIDVMQQPENEKISTLMTCTPVGTTLRRLIIQAKDVTNEGNKRPKLPTMA